MNYFLPSSRHQAAWFDIHLYLGTFIAKTSAVSSIVSSFIIFIFCSKITQAESPDL
jgi:hypothetical protein